MNRKVIGVGLGLVVPLLAILIANIGRDPHAVASPLVGRDAPPFTLPSLREGVPISLERFRGKPVVLNFWASWCVPCEEEHGVLVTAARAEGQAVQFLGVVYEDEPSRIQAFLEQRGESYPTVLDVDGKTAIAYGVYGVPETYFIDAAGRIAAKHVGPLDGVSLADKLGKAKGGRS